MNKLKEIKKHFKDTTIEKAFYTLLIKYDLYDLPVVFALSELTEEQLIKLKIFYKANNYEDLIDKITEDIEYIIEG